MTTPLGGDAVPVASDIDDLLAKIRADPEDLAARMVYGDALVEAGDPLGELVTAQCALAGAGVFAIDDLVDADVDGVELARLVGIQRRVDQLWEQHREQWSAPLRLPEGTSVYFRRGMPEVIYNHGLVYLEPQPVVPVIERLAKVAPIAELHLKFKSNVVGLHRLAPLLGHVVELVLETVDVTWEVVEELVAAAPRLRRLGLQQLPLDGAGLERLGRSPVMRQLESLDVGSARGFGPEAIIGVVAALPHLVVRASRCRFTDADVAMLVERAPTLRGVDVTDTPLGIAALRALVSLPALRHLGFDPGVRSELDPEEVGKVIANGQAPLRSLKLGPINWKGLQAIAAAPQLAGLRSLELQGVRQRDLVKRGNQAIGRLRELVVLKLPWEALHPVVDLSTLPLLVKFQKMGLEPPPKRRAPARRRS